MGARGEPQGIGLDAGAARTRIETIRAANRTPEARRTPGGHPGGVCREDRASTSWSGGGEVAPDRITTMGAMGTLLKRDGRRAQGSLGTRKSDVCGSATQGSSRLALRGPGVDGLRRHLDSHVLPQPVLELREQGQGIIAENLAADPQRVLFVQIATVDLSASTSARQRRVISVAP